MGDLDSRLKAIKLRNTKDRDGHNIPRTHLSSAEIEMVKQAFAEELDAKATRVLESNYMSGQVWYDRFEKELMSINIFAIEDGVEPEMVNAIKEAAKRASGIKETHNDL